MVYQKSTASEDILEWPHGASAAIALTRVEIPALRPGMVVPILRFQLGIIIGFDQRRSNSDDGATQYPQCLRFTKADMDAKRPLIVFTDTGVRTVLMDHITDLLRKKYSPLIGPDTTVAQRNDGGGPHGTRSASTRTECIHPSPAHSTQ